MFKTYSPVGEQPCVVVPIEVRANLMQQSNTSVSELVIKHSAAQQGSQPPKRWCLYSTLIMNVKLMGSGSLSLSTCHPASMLLRSSPKDPPKIQSWDKLNSLGCSILGSHTLMVALAP